jgi:hypothetical protein
MTFGLTGFVLATPQATSSPVSGAGAQSSRSGSGGENAEPKSGDETRGP